MVVFVVWGLVFVVSMFSCCAEVCFSFRLVFYVVCFRSSFPDFSGIFGWWGPFYVYSGCFLGGFFVVTLLVFFPLYACFLVLARFLWFLFLFFLCVLVGGGSSF